MSFRLGLLEELILLAVAQLGNQAHAVAVQRRIEEASLKAPTMGAIYTSLERLEKKGLLRSELGSVTPRPGGRRKRHYQLTGSGSAALVDSRTTRERLWDGLKLDNSTGLLR